MSNRREFIAQATAGVWAAAATTWAHARPTGSGKSRPLLISGATLIDGVADRPVEDSAIWIEGGRIKAVGRAGELRNARTDSKIDARGKFVIPGLMNANVHLLMDIRIETLSRYWGRYDELILEAAQVALKNGQTTVFDTYGPRRFLMAARDRIAAGEAPGSRIFCAGNIVGLDGPFSADFDFFAKGLNSASQAMIRRINAIWVENVGRRLMWMTPEQVAQEVRAYIGKGIDFIKYASNDHVPGAFIAFSPRAQELMVEEARRAHITAQAHTMSVEGLRIAVEAGCDLIQHANMTGPVEIPQTLVEAIAHRNTGVSVFPYTQRRLDRFMNTESYMSGRGAPEWQVGDNNVRNFVRAGARLLLANDGALIAAEGLNDPRLASVLAEDPEEGSLFSLANGHFYWLKAMEEKGCAPMAMLQAATRNIAVAYGKDKDLGTVEAGKIADLLILDKNPLQSAANYQSIHSVIKDGVPVDRQALPAQPMLTKPMEPPVEEEKAYVPFTSESK